MVFILLGFIAVAFLVSGCSEKPKRENDTIKKVEVNIQLQEKASAEERRLEKEASDIRAERAKLEADKERADRELEAERQRQREEKKRQFMQEEEAERMAAQYREREKKIKEEQRRLQELEEKMKANERALAEDLRKAKELAEKTRLQAENGFPPVIWPTRDEYQRGRELVQYNPKNLHFAIIGKAGSGKSSLINAFLNLQAGDPGAARTGVTETTSKIGRYPDPGREAPRPWTIWYDIPGAGTQNVSARQYFINQGLFVFDIILLTIGDRFEETDVELLRDCQRFEIPALIVRSKADMHIENLIKGKVGRLRNSTPEISLSCRDTFIEESRRMVQEELVKAQLPDQRVYLVDNYILREVYSTPLQDSESNPPPEMIDERALTQDIMLLTIQRRGDRKALEALQGQQ